MDDGNDFCGANAGAAQEVEDSAGQEELDSVNSNPSIEIVVDGSELLGEGIGREDVQLSITFDKVDGAEGTRSEIADRLDGVEVIVNLHGNQEVDIEIVPPCLENEEVMEDAGGVADCSNTLPPASDPEDKPFERTDVMEMCNGDCNQMIERKRHRNDTATEGRCLKSRTGELTEQGDLSDGLGGHLELAEPDTDSDSLAKSQLVDLQHAGGNAPLAEDLKMNEHGVEDSSDSSRITNATRNVIADGTIDKACVSHGTDDLQCSNGSTEVASFHNSVKKCGSADDKGHLRPRKRRKIAMFLAYCGAGYQGMQKNPGAVTIEGLLEEALSKAGAMPEKYDGNPRKVDWMRAARTDKGVSAVGQVVSGLFYIDPPGFIERVNAHLAKNIRLLGYTRVTPTFNAKNLCDRRRYEYVIPIFALDPSTHRDREAVSASEGTDDALVKCQECSERGRKIPAGKISRKLSVVDGKEPKIFDGHNKATESLSPSINEKATTIKSCYDVTCVEAEPQTGLGVTDLTSLNAGEEKQGLMVASSNEKKDHFHFGNDECAKLNRILSYFVGTHNFHNFTSRVKAEDPSAKRYIISFKVGNVFTVRNTEFVRCIVVGQSFMLHQIRKMIGLAIAVFRGFAPESVIETALRRDTNIIIPTAPELGLFLDECMYPAYNKKWFATHEEVSQKGYEKEIDCFKQDVIYEHIAVTEDKEGQMALFLHSLNDRNYADLASARDGAAKAESS